MPNTNTIGYDVMRSKLYREDLYKELFFEVDNKPSVTKLSEMLDIPPRIVCQELKALHKKYKIPLMTAREVQLIKKEDREDAEEEKRKFREVERATKSKQKKVKRKLKVEKE